MQRPPPALTFALLTQDGFSTIARTVSHVAAQKEASSIELLVVTDRPENVRPDAAAIAPFHSFRVVLANMENGSGRARAEAVGHASAAIIAFGEDHCFPDVGWAAALLDAHRGDWAAVGPVVSNANPTTIVSWADLLMGYGDWLAPGFSGVRPHLPGHNSSYKRTPLLAMGDELPTLIEAESPLQWRLREQGYKLYQDSRARAAHTNFEKWGVWLHVLYHAGRVFAATRSLNWSLPHRVLFAAAAPLIPLVRFQRHIRQAFRAGWRLPFVTRVAPVLLVGLLVDAAGQFMGVLFGAGRSRAELVDWEFRRNEPRQKGQRRAA